MPPLRRILVADGDQGIRHLLQASQQKRGYEVDTVPEGRVALDQMMSALPDLLNTDLVMPGLTGWSVLSRGADAAPWLPIIVIGGMCDV